METQKNKVATVRKEGVSDSGKPSEAINEAKGMDTVEKPVFTHSDWEKHFKPLYDAAGTSEEYQDKVRQGEIDRMNGDDWQYWRKVKGLPINCVENHN